MKNITEITVNINYRITIDNADIFILKACEMFYT